MTSNQPRVTGISPLKGTPGTKITIRGENFGKKHADFLSITICGIDCTLSAEWISPSKIIARPGSSPSQGDIIVTTKNAPPGVSLVQFHCHIPDIIGLLEDSGCWVCEDEANATPEQVDILHLLPDPPIALPLEQCNVNSPDFDPEAYIFQIYSSVSFDSLKSGLQALKTHIRPRDQEPLVLLKKNLPIHFDSFRRIKDLSQSLPRINSECPSLSNLYDAVYLCFNGLLCRHDQVERMRQLVTHFTRWRSLFTLPSALEQHIRAGHYQQAIDDFNKTLLLRQSKAPSVLQLIYAHSEKRIDQLRHNLRNSLLEDCSLGLKEQSHALAISQDPALVREFLGAQFGRIKRKLCKDPNPADCLSALSSISQEVSGMIQEFTALCEFCRSLELDPTIAELTEGLTTSLLKLYIKTIRNMLPSIERINQADQLDRLKCALFDHRRCAQVLSNESEQLNIARLSRATRLSCLNAYMNCCHVEIGGLLLKYRSALDCPQVLKLIDWFPAQLYDIILMYIEKIDENVVSPLERELDFFDTSSTRVCFSRHFSGILGLVTEALKGLVREDLSWLQLFVYIVDIENIVGTTVRAVSQVLEAHKFPKSEDQIAEFVKSCLRREDDLFRRLAKIKCHIRVSTKEQFYFNGLSAYVHNLMNGIVSLCAEMALVSPLLTKRVVKHLCDDYLAKLLSKDIVNRLDVTDLVALRHLCGDLCGKQVRDKLSGVILSRGDVDADTLLLSFRKQFALQLESISLAIS